MKKKKISHKQMTQLLKTIRESTAYWNWRQAVLRKWVPSYPNVPKNTQVHHLKRVIDILKDNEVTCIEDAMRCKELWKVDNGIVLTRGEHQTVTYLERFKRPSDGFVIIVREWLSRCEGNSYTISNHEKPLC